MNRAIQLNLHSPWIGRAFFLGFVLMNGLLLLGWREISQALFGLLVNTGMVFSVLLSLLFFVGWAVITDRVLFWFFYSGIGKRFVVDSPDPNNFFTCLKELARERATGYKPINEDHEARLKQIANVQSLGGQNIHRGEQLLETLAVLAPTLGFIGTLVGLIQSFRELAAGAETISILSGLGVAMGTSLIGAVISVLFTIFLLFQRSIAANVETIVDSIMAEAQAAVARPYPHPLGGNSPKKELL